jgi:hypothetical protein
VAASLGPPPTGPSPDSGRGDRTAGPTARSAGSDGSNGILASMEAAAASRSRGRPPLRAVANTPAERAGAADAAAGGMAAGNCQARSTPGTARATSTDSGGRSSTGTAAEATAATATAAAAGSVAGGLPVSRRAAIERQMATSMKMHRAMLHRQEGQLKQYGAAPAADLIDDALPQEAGGARARHGGRGDVTPNTRRAAELLASAASMAMPALHAGVATVTVLAEQDDAQSRPPSRADWGSRSPEPARGDLSPGGAQNAAGARSDRRDVRGAEGRTQDPTPDTASTRLAALLADLMMAADRTSDAHACSAATGWAALQQYDGAGLFGFLEARGLARGLPGQRGGQGEACVSESSPSARRSRTPSSARE